MPEANQRHQAAQAATAAAWLALGQPAHQLSVAVTTLALLFTGMNRASGSLAFWLLTLIAGCVEFYCALRTRFDERIFSSWAVSWQRGDAAPENDMAEFDLAINRTPALCARPLSNRIHGARRLLRAQFSSLFVQIAASSAALIYGVLHVA